MKRSTLLISLVAVLVLVLLGARFYLSEGDFQMTNPSWNGINGMTGEIGATPLYDISELSGASSNDTLMVIGPNKNYTADESLQVKAFLDRGGTVVVMDDFGTANSLLSGLGAPVSIGNATLCQYENYYINQTLPVITDIVPSPYTVNVSRLVLNHPAALQVSDSASVIATSSRDSWLDINNNYKLDPNERLGSYPVAAVVGEGSGELIVVSDSDPFINGMLDKGDNRAFLSDLARGRVYVDAAHGSDLTPLGALYYLIKDNFLVQLAVLILLLGICIVYMARDTFSAWLQEWKAGR